MINIHATGLATAILAALLGASPAAAQCAATLSIGGVGQVIAKQVEPYVACLNSTHGTPQQIHSSCSEARGLSAQSRDVAIDKGKLDQTLRWLDAMIVERAACETQLSVKA